MVLRDAYRLPRRTAVGIVLGTLGAVLALLSGVAAAVGLERALTFWNDQMALLPWGLHRVLGITVYLSIPTSIPRYSVIAGAVLALAGSALAFTRRSGRNSFGEVVESAGSGSTEL